MSTPTREDYIQAINAAAERGDEQAVLNINREMEQAFSAQADGQRQSGGGFQPMGMLKAVGELVERPEGAARSAGLLARDVVEGTTAIPAMAANAVGYAANKGLEAAGSGVRFPDQQAALSGLLTEAGLPQPENSQERVISDVQQAVTSGGGLLKGAQMLAKYGAPAASKFGAALAEQPATQLASEVGASGLSGAVREAGGNGVLQTLAGLAGGLGAGGAPFVASSARQAHQGLVDGFTEQGQRRIAGDILAGQADDVTKAQTNIRERVETLTPQGTGAASSDSGLMGFYRAMKAKDGTGRFRANASAANAERMNILDALVPEDMDAMVAARAEATAPMREAAMGGAERSPIVIGQAVRRIVSFGEKLAKTDRAFREPVQKVLRKEIDGVERAETVGQLYEARKGINDVIKKPMSRSQSNGERDEKGANSLLRDLRQALDVEMEKMAPGFSEYITKYRQMSEKINQKETIEDFKDRGTVAAPDKREGEVVDVLSQAKFRRMLKQERKKKPLDGRLPDEMLDVLDAIARDLDESVAPNSLRSGGSDTAQNLTVAAIIGRAYHGKGADSALTQTVLRPLGWVMQAPTEKVTEVLTDAMLDPDLAAALLQDATQRNVEMVSYELSNRFRAAMTGTAVGLPSYNGRPSDLPGMDDVPR